ncbi:uncharacterized protein LOC142173014 [Nicotiana tabacum]|uniref:Uncharacterized protein LOC142173014 n=1 Tax=Nicotiana tabacum TaxID=4097 RepID=A0AC58T8Y9_TOBAC
MVMSKIAYGWNMITNYEHAVNGRVWIIWDDQMYDVLPITKQDQFIHCQVTWKHNGMQCYLNMVYGQNTVEQRKNLWQYLQRIAQTTTGPWIIGGDFNALLTPQDRLSKVSMTNADIRDFSELYHNICLTELPWRGDYFKWTNKQQGDARVWICIDRLLGNDVWMMNYAHIVIGFVNVWANHASFQSMVAKGWRKNKASEKIKNIWFKLKELKSQFRHLNTTEFKGVTEKIEQARIALSQITEIQAPSGFTITEPTTIREENVQFYKSLMRSMANKLPAVNMMVMKNGKILTHQQQIELCAEVTDHEIYDGLKGIGSDKAPGIDGYNAEFFKRAWPVIREEVYVAVKDFFHTGVMYLAINCTTITLLPKILNPVTIKDFRPIACCTVLYKLISKVIAGRLKRIMPYIISEAQSGFIPGRKIADNIILAHELVKA